MEYSPDRRRRRVPANSMHPRLHLWALPAMAPVLALAQQPGTEPALPEIVVSVTHAARTSADLPASVDVIEAPAIREANAMVNLSEPLVRVPGVVVQNRNNYAQDLQVSVRGFGARSTFGVRGVRLYADGIPATMPDGQGQASHFDLASARRIEVLRGPFSALYGNSSGGVVSVLTENAAPGFHLEPWLQFGSDGFSHEGLKASGQESIVNYVVSGNRFHTSGYRAHSAATRDTGNARLRADLGDTTLTVVANAVRMPDVQDPLGVAREQFTADPRATDPTALLFNTRKSVDQRQLGLNLERDLGERDRLGLVLYGGRRSTVQYQAIPPAAQTAPSSAGGVIDLGRDYAGGDLRWTREQPLGPGTLQTTVGVSLDDLDEDRKGYENFVGTTLGVRGRLRRDEDNTARNFDQYLEAQWRLEPRWTLLAGVRHSEVRIESTDRFLANGNDSGAVTYRATNPVVGATWRPLEDLRVYASFGRGFETPTLNELSYRPATAGTAAAGFNFSLQPARSNNYEIGIKAGQGQQRVNVALFHIDTDNELTVLSNTGGRAVYQNAGATRRDGIELEATQAWAHGLTGLLSAAWMRARYAADFCSGPCTPASRVPSGNRIPGVPERTLYGEVAWKSGGFSTALEGKAVGPVQVDDVNSDHAPGYFLANVRATWEQRGGNWKLRESLRVDNLADRKVIGSVIVNEGNRRFFEPAPGRSWLAGVTLTRDW
ncbi:TonB-dependent receptor [Oxalobacteraceae bacterium OM1]|nr:TonB-dependent receptor [Oxalobacteraceae bacterium OM1]